MSPFEKFITIVVFSLFFVLFSLDGKIDSINVMMQCMEIKAGYFKSNDDLLMSKSIKTVYFEDINDKVNFEKIALTNNITVETMLKPNLRIKPKCHLILA